MNKYFGPRPSFSARPESSGGAEETGAGRGEDGLRGLAGRRAGPFRRRRFRAVPLRLILPNLVTLLALSVGLTSIRFAVEGQFEFAVLAVLIAAILDALDGRLA